MTSREYKRFGIPSREALNALSPRRGPITRSSVKSPAGYKRVWSLRWYLSRVATTSTTFEARNITRPDRALLTYYIIAAVLSGPFVVVVLIPLLFRYHTLKYRFDDEGISMSWGVIFHQEVYLQYRRIQDIHVTRNVLHRWLGLSAVSVQTAAGSAAAEMRIEGIKDPEALRDFLYTRMRGARGLDAPSAPAHPATPDAVAAATASPDDEALALLREIRDVLRDQRAGDRA